MKAGAPRVLLADDHPPTRAGVRAVLEAAGFTVCAEAPDATGAVELAESERPDVCLLDIRMPGGGIAAAAEIHRRLPETAIVMLSVSHDDADLFDALRAGAAGYLLKDMDPARIGEAIRGVLAGEAALPRTLAARLIDEFRGRDRRRQRLRRAHGVDLTEREWEVLERLAQGGSTTTIAEAMAVAPVTVRRHVSEIVSKLGVPSREEAVRLISDED